VDDGTQGDVTAGDHYFTNNSVRIDLPEVVEPGSYTVRIAAADHTLRSVSVADAEPLMVVESTVSAGERVGSAGFSLGQNFPNPVSEMSRFKYEIPQMSHVEITLHDLLGKPVQVLVNETRTPGMHVVEFDSGWISPGSYFYTMKAGEFFTVRKMQIMH
jgi:hypothetical protein